MERTVTRMHRPGKTAAHQAIDRLDWALASMLPHDAVGGWMPRPKNDKVDSVMMTPATSRVAWTTMGATALGKRCLKMILRSLLPNARAASANSLSRRLRNDARTKRATVGHDKAPMMITMTPKLKLAFVELAATMAVSTRSS